MSGERPEPNPQARAQPGGRPAAPGPLALVQAFVNTHFDLGARFGEDLLRSPDALADWLDGAGLGPVGPLSESDLRLARELRESLRALAANGGEPAAAAQARRALDAIAAGARVQLRFGPAGPTLSGVPRAGLAGACGELLAIVAAAMGDGQWSRMKVCPGEHCGWLFHDGSRNRSGRWCSMSVCGGRHKARAHYQRRRGEQ